MVLGIATGVEFLDYFCAFWNLLVIFHFDLKMGGGGGKHLSIALPFLSLLFPPTPPPGSTTDKGVLCEVCYLVSNGGRNYCGCGCCFVLFFLPVLLLSGICLFIIIFLVWEKAEGTLS